MAHPAALGALPLLRGGHLIDRRTLVSGALGAGAVAATGGLLAGGLGHRPTPAHPLLTDASFRTTTVLDAFRRDGWAADDERRLGVAAWVRRGRVPGAGTRWQSMAYWALVDLKCLLAGNGAMSAGAAPAWGYAWVRDNAFAVAALVRSHHRAEALAMLDFMRFAQRADGGFEARDLLSGGGPPDGRPRQSDGAAWSLWALAQLLSVPPDPSRDQLDAAMAPRIASTAASELAPFRGMVDRAVGFIRRDVRHGRGISTPSPDYWERREGELTLWIVASHLVGLRSAALLYGALGAAAAATQVDDAAEQLEDRLHRAFGPYGYQRYRREGGVDAAVCLLLPPFTGSAPAGVVEAWLTYQQQAARPAGGLAPGTGWRQDGISWTPETSLVASTSAAAGRPALAGDWLDWLDAHRVSWGSLPEKVLADGSPAGPAPLGWTASNVLLALDQRVT